MWGAQAEHCANYLRTRRPVAIDGRLEWREYTGQDGQTRQTVEVIAETVQFLGGPEETANAQDSASGPGRAASASSGGEFGVAPASAGSIDDDIRSDDRRPRDQRRATRLRYS